MERRVQHAWAILSRLTGKNYPELRKALETMPDPAIADLIRLALDLEFAIRNGQRQAALQPWRHW